MDTSSFQQVTYGYVEIAKYLVENGADVNAPTSKGGWTPLYHGKREDGYFEMVKYLVENGADVNAPTSRVVGHLFIQASAGQVILKW